jgi:predicted amidohydrolase
MHIAAVQLDIRWEDRPGNHARVRQLLDRVDLPAGTLVVLPEMFDTGFSINTTATDPGEKSSSEAFCRALSAERNVAVLASFVTRAEAGRFANEAVAFSPAGSELARYRKMQPFTGGTEHLHYAGGSRHVLFEWQGMKIAPFICYDLRFPELFRPAVRDGAELIVVVANWPEKRSEHWVRLLQARAIENLAYALGVNRCGQDPNLNYDGRSCLFDHLGREVFQADGREQVLLAEIDPQPVRKWRHDFPALRDMKPA